MSSPEPQHTTTVVIPTYNEAENVRVIVERVLGALATDVLIVDDSSPDGTGRIADEMAAADGRVHVLHRPLASGFAGAYRDGFMRAIEDGYALIFQMDADGSHDPATLPVMRAALDGSDNIDGAATEGGCDLVIGSRYMSGGALENWPWFRRWLSNGGGIYARLLLGVPVSDPTGGFKGWRADLPKRIEPATTQSEGYVFQIETTLRAQKAGARVQEVPITFRERVAGTSKMSSAIIFEAAFRVLVMALRGGRYRG